MIETESRAKAKYNQLYRAIQDPENGEGLREAAQGFVDVLRAEIDELLAQEDDREPANDNSHRGFCLAYNRQVRQEKLRFYMTIIQVALAGVGYKAKLPVCTQKRLEDILRSLEKSGGPRADR